MTQIALIIAQNPVLERLKGLQQGFNTKQTVAADMTSFLWFMVGAATVLLIVFAWSRRRQQKALHLVPAHPLRLYAAGLRNLGIGFFDRLVLEFVAFRCGAAHPAAMLISRDLLEKRAGRWADRVAPRSIGRFFRARVDLLRRAAFPGE